MQNLTPAQMFALAFGVVYMLVGLIGFGVTGFNGWFASDTAEKLIIFPLNGIHNVVHIAAGLVWMMSSSTHAGAKRTNTVLGVVFAALVVLGFAGLAKWAAVESGFSADNLLHLVTAAASLFFGLAAPASRFAGSYR